MISQADFELFLKIPRERSGFTIPGINKLLIALRYFAVGCFSEPLADMFGVSKSTACNIVSEVAFLIGLKLSDTYIRMPIDVAELQKAKAMFYRIGQFPLVIAAVDGTNIRIQSLGGENAEMYRNRKTYFSLNCQLAVSAEVIIFFVNLFLSV